MRIKYFIAATLLVLAGVAIWPQIDLTVSGWFYEPDKGFIAANFPLFVGLHGLAYYGARAMGVMLALLTLVALLRRGLILGIDAKGWLFLLLALSLAPGLIANVVLKDHWGRARPREVVAFGGAEKFSPALEPQAVKHPNGSFVSGDAAFGFFLPSFAYVIPRRLSRRFFWSGMGAGMLFGMVRLAMGAHFLSDILYAAAFMVAAIAALHAILFGPRCTKRYWREWLFSKKTFD